jgi:hypothetical protein
MKVTVYDVDKPDRKVDGDYTIDTTLGLPALGDEIYLRSRDYNADLFYMTATVRRRCWFFSDNKPQTGEVQIWVQRHGK